MLYGYRDGQKNFFSQTQIIKFENMVVQVWEHGGRQHEFTFYCLNKLLIFKKEIALSSWKTKILLLQNLWENLRTTTKEQKHFWYLILTYIILYY